MPDTLGPPSEFGGKVQKNGVQPPPHEPTASEKMMLLYTTGDETGNLDPERNGESWDGLLPYDEQLQLRIAEGVMEKGQIWEEMTSG